jgi:hypothetical protein
MIYELIKYTRQFDGPVIKEWIGLEGRLQEGDNEDIEFAKLKAKVHQWADADSSGNSFVKEIPVEKPIPEQERLALMIGDILKCEKLEGDDGLLSYKSFVDRASKPDITKAYEIRLKQLSK